MADIERLEIIAKVDEEGQVVSAKETTPSVEQPVSDDVRPDIAKDVGDEVANALENAASSPIEDATLRSLEDLTSLNEKSLLAAVQSALAREASLRLLRDINKSIEDLRRQTGQPPAQPPEPPKEPPAQLPPPEPDDDGPQSQPSNGGALVPDKNVINEVPIGKSLAIAVGAATGIPVGPIMAGVAATVAFTAALAGATVAAQLYSAFLAALVDSIGELSAELKMAQAESARVRLEQQQDFADRFGDSLASIENNRSDMNAEIREFRASMTDKFSESINLITSSVQLLFNVLNAILLIMTPALEIVKAIAGLLNQLLKVVNAILDFVTLNWFDDEDPGTNAWDDMMQPENIGLNTGRTVIRRTDKLDFDDIMKKNT